jgi:pyruvate/2-oxoglutarate dehydrogenase complex dihydrolipoamide acyltransferase (E2) component
VVDQVLGRIDRATTMSVPRFISLYSEGFEVDRARRSRMESKMEIQQAIRGGEIAELSYANNISTEIRGDRVFAAIVRLDFNRGLMNTLKEVIKSKAGGAPKWLYLKNRRVHSVDIEVWPQVEAALKSVFGEQVSNLETPPAKVAPEPDAIAEAEAFVQQIEETVAPPRKPRNVFEHYAQKSAKPAATQERTGPAPSDDTFFDRDAERLASDYGISVDDIMYEGTGPNGAVTVADVEAYWERNVNYSQSFELFAVQKPLLGNTAPVLAKDLLLDMQKNTKRSAPMYDLMSFLSRRRASS